MRNERESRARFLLGRLLTDIYKDECAAELLRDAIYYSPGMAEAHVDLGIVYCRLERFEEMLGAFREAIRLDERATRAAIRDEPAELEAIGRVLYPERPTPAPMDEAGVAAIPGFVRETAALVGLAREHIGSGRDAEAVAALEASLRLDETYQYAVALLALAYLGIKKGAGMELTEVKRSVLWEEKPALAELLFEGWESTPTVSH